MSQTPSDEEIEWLRRLKAAADAGVTPAEMPVPVAGRLGELGFVWSSGLGDVEITEAGRSFLRRLDA